MQNFIQNPYPPLKPPEHEKFITQTHMRKPTHKNHQTSNPELHQTTPRRSTTPNPPSTNPNPPSTCHQQHQIHLVEAQLESRSTKQYENNVVFSWDENDNFPPPSTPESVVFLFRLGRSTAHPHWNPTKPSLSN